MFDAAAKPASENEAVKTAIRAREQGGGRPAAKHRGPDTQHPWAYRVVKAPVATPHGGQLRSPGLAACLWVVAGGTRGGGMTSVEEDRHLLWGGWIKRPLGLCINPLLFPETNPEVSLPSFPATAPCATRRRDPLAPSARGMADFMAKEPPQGSAMAGAPSPHFLPLPPPLVLIGVGTETFLRGQFKSLAFYLL